VIASLGVAGVGTGLVMPNVATTALSLAPPQMRGRVAGGVTASVFAGQFASPLLAGPFIAGHGYAATYLGAAVLLALISASAAAIGLRLRRAG
jgi:MFS family permease